MKPTILLISQVYVPDPASVGQHVADVAIELASRGYRVVVYTSARGYEDPGLIYPSQEVRDGVDVRRLPLSSFGKSTVAIRILAQSIFLLQAIALSLLTRRLCCVIVSTSPPFCGIAGAVISKLRRVPFKYWLMDMNPDQMVAMKLISPKSLSVKLFEAFNRITLRRAKDIIVLDRFMYDRVKEKTKFNGQMHIIPPWPHIEKTFNLEHNNNPFRNKQVPIDGFCLMYSGNHSQVNPLTTLLDAISCMVEQKRLLLMCIGGGNGKKEVDELIISGAVNIRSLPYQHLDEIRFSLSAADVHVVSLGNELVGIVHPCKIYGAMAVSRPILFIGPSESHIGDLIKKYQIGWQTEHGDQAAAIAAIQEILSTPQEKLRKMGENASNAISKELSKRYLLMQFCKVILRDIR